MDNQEGTQEEQAQELVAPPADPAPAAPPQVTAPAPTATIPPQADVASTALAGLYRQIAGGASWFYWIAGLSLINTLIAAFGGNIRFIFGLGATEIADSAISEFGRTALIVVLPINLFIAGIYCLFGYFAGRRARWAFVVGIVFYALDALLVLLVKDILGVAFHAYVLYRLTSGLSADSRARKMEAQAQTDYPV